MLQPERRESSNLLSNNRRRRPNLFSKEIDDKAGIQRTSLSSRALAYFDSVVASPLREWKMESYFAHTTDYLTKVVPKDKKVLMIGCLTSEILEALQPSIGVGLDASRRLVDQLNLKHTNADSNLSFYACMPEKFDTDVKFDYVILLNIVDHSHDVLALIGSLQKFVHEDSRVIVSMMNPLWHSLTRLASRLKIRIPDYERNLVASRSLTTALEIKNFRVTDVCRRILMPKRIPFLTQVLNQFLARLPGFNALCFMQYISAKPMALRASASPSCSVLIPCYNEEGNIEECIRRVPQMGSFTEIVVINDGSKDRTHEIVNGLREQFPNLNFISYSKNRGKGNAVLTGLQQSAGDIVMILDADMTVPPEELVEFYEALASGASDFASGTRFLYPMEREAMRFANFVGNILFSKLVQIIVGSECSDTLCGTKAMRRIDFKGFKLEDSAWGDFDFIFHAARMKLKCVQIPVHYKSRVQGESKMKAFSSGVSFLKLCFRKWSELP